MTTYNPAIPLRDYEPESSPLADRVLEVPADVVPVYTSFADAISEAIEQASGNPRIKVIHIDLGDGDRWWHTRLFLVAALAADYTRVEAIVFQATCEADGQQGCFVGTAAPAAVRDATADGAPHLHALVNYRQAQIWAETMPLAPGTTTRAEVVRQFIGSVPQPESAYKIDVTPLMLRQWLGGELVEASVLVPVTSFSAPVTREQLSLIIAWPEPFVALTAAGRLVQMIDRCALASRVAAEALIQAP